MKMSEILNKLDTSPETLTRIYVEDGTTPQFKEFAEKLPQATALKELDLREEEIGRSEKTTEIIAKGVSENTSLTELILNNNYLGNKISFFKEALLKNSSITSLSLFNNHIHPDAAPAIAELIEKDPYLTELNIGCNDLQDEGVKVIAQALQKNITLRELKLSNARFSDAGAEEMAKVLKTNPHLTKVDLSFNSQLTSEGITSLANALKENRGLTSFDLSYLKGNQMSDAVAKAFVDALKENKTLTQLNIDASKVSPEIMEEINTLLEENKGRDSSSGYSPKR